MTNSLPRHAAHTPRHQQAARQLNFADKRKAGRSQLQEIMGKPLENEQAPRASTPATHGANLPSSTDDARRDLTRNSPKSKRKTLKTSVPEAQHSKGDSRKSGSRKATPRKSDGVASHWKTLERIAQSPESVGCVPAKGARNGTQENKPSGISTSTTTNLGRFDGRAENQKSSLQHAQEPCGGKHENHRRITVDNDPLNSMING